MLADDQNSAGRACSHEQDPRHHEAGPSQVRANHPGVLGILSVGRVLADSDELVTLPSHYYSGDWIYVSCGIW